MVVNAEAMPEKAPASPARTTRVRRGTRCWEHTAPLTALEREATESAMVSAGGWVGPAMRVLYVAINSEIGRAHV